MTKNERRGKDEMELEEKKLVAKGEADYRQN